VYRQAKLRCGGPDGQLGSWLNTFQGPKNITSSLQICADAGDPNIVRLPAYARTPTSLHHILKFTGLTQNLGQL
jgi:hypothetical protein